VPWADAGYAGPVGRSDRRTVSWPSRCIESHISAVHVRARLFTSCPCGSAEASPMNQLACTPGTTVKPLTSTSSVSEAPRALSQTATSAAGSLEVARPRSLLRYPASAAGSPMARAKRRYHSVSPAGVDTAFRGGAWLCVEDEVGVSRVAAEVAGPGFGQQQARPCRRSLGVVAAEDGTEVEARALIPGLPGHASGIGQLCDEVHDSLPAEEGKE
jgi:hypothetical protein